MFSMQCEYINKLIYNQWQSKEDTLYNARWDDYFLDNDIVKKILNQYNFWYKFKDTKSADELFLNVIVTTETSQSWNTTAYNFSSYWLIFDTVNFSSYRSIFETVNFSSYWSIFETVNFSSY